MRIIWQIFEIFTHTHTRPIIQLGIHTGHLVVPELIPLLHLSVLMYPLTELCESCVDARFIAARTAFSPAHYPTLEPNISLGQTNQRTA